MAGRRKLPLVTEQSLANLRLLRTQFSTDFGQELQRTAQDTQARITCRVGCSNCCYHPVLITAIEGALLFRWLSERGRWTPAFRARVREHANQTRDLSFEVWFLSVIACPLLDEATKKCTAYDARPYQCRVTYSLGNPDTCHPHRIEQTDMVNKQSVMAAYHSAQNKLAKKHGLQMVLMPLSLALIIGEQIVHGEIDLEDADYAVLREFKGSQ